jgi:protein tyrosine/serine phosphatase
VLHLPILHDTWDAKVSTEANRAPITFLADRYLEMTEIGSVAIAGAFEVLASPQRLPVAFHCSAGKDRTGVLAALVLAALGVDDAQIAEDYALSARAMDKLVAWMSDHRAEVAEQMVRQHAALLSCPPEAILLFLEELRARHGGVRLYLGDIGVGRATIEALQDNLLEG